MYGRAAVKDWRAAAASAMFESLTNRLEGIFKELRRRGKLRESDVDEAMQQVRRALLEADVHYKVARDFVARVRERAIGQEVSRALNPGQQVVKIVNEELIETLGSPDKLNLAGPKPRVILLVGLQGSGKTTTAGKLAQLLREQGERVMLAAADPYRPAAAEQLEVLGEQLGVPVHARTDLEPPDLVDEALKLARRGGFSVLIVDTAGRSQLDGALMEEISAIDKVVTSAETLLVIDAMTGQEALHIASGFREAIRLTGLVLTKMDGDSRGGAAISIRSVTGVPIKFLGVSENLDGIERFDPKRLASRILGMGDMIGLIERAESALDQEEAEKQADKLISGEFTLEDFARQLKSIRKLGPIGQLMDMMPGQLGQAARGVNPQDAERQMRMTEAIINSMTAQERRRPGILNGSRRRRIARGSGTRVQDVNRLMKQFRDMKRLFKQINKTGGRGFSRLFG